ncbi:MAG TPA: ABC transporter substrate-binding protein [Myxococcaceae bacterium]|nr:ABC transporter substrate-binding protein [Myxococcaceae bacterium]
MRPILAAVLTSCALALVACEKKASAPPPPPGPPSGGTAAPPSGGGTPGVTADTILIGEVGSLTGSEATFGISTRNAIELALREVNAAGGVKGKKIEIRVYDNQSKPEEAAQAANRLINQDQVLLILGEVASSNSMAMAEKAQPAKVPMISNASTNPKVTEIGDYIFRVCFIDPFQGYVMAKFAHDNLKFTKVAVLRDLGSAYSQGLADVFERKFTEMGGKIVARETYTKGSTDFRSQLTAIKRAQPDGIYIPGYYNDIGLIARQARELGITGKLMGGDGWDSEKLFELGGAAVEGSYFSNHYSPDDPNPRIQKFIADYKAAFGSVPDALAALGYDAAMVAVDAMKRAPTLDRASVRDAIAATKNFPGVTGTITLDDKRNATKSAVVLEVGKGKTKYVATIAP